MKIAGFRGVFRLFFLLTMIRRKREVVKIFNEYLSNVVLNLDIQRPIVTLHHDEVLNKIKKLENHLTILEIKNQVPSDVAFTFSISKVTLNEIINEIKNLDESQATQSNDVSMTFLEISLLETLIT